MAKKSQKASSLSGFRVVGAGISNQNLVGDAPDAVRKWFQKKCRSRKDVMFFLVEYAAKKGYLGLAKYSGFNDSLSIDFVDVDGGSYSLDVSFMLHWHISRSDPETDEYDYHDADSYFTDDEEILNWHESDGKSAQDESSDEVE